MKDSIRPGKRLPESAADFTELIRAGQPGLRDLCKICGEDFGPWNTSTAAGWRETQVSGSCEACFDRLFAEPLVGDDE